MQGKSVWINIRNFLCLFLIISAVGYLGRAYMTSNTLKWYRTLQMSSLTPPDYIFGCVWSVLFLFMTISVFLVWGRARLKWFIFQLVLNMFWSFSFFFLHLPALALAAVLLMLFCILECIKEFYRYSKVSGLLFVPLFVWSLFALYLNTIIVMQNIDKI